MPRLAKPEELTTNYTSRELLRDAWGYIKPAKGKLLLVSLLAISRELVALYPAFAFSQIITLLSSGDRTAHLTELRLIFGLYIVAMFWQIGTYYFYKIASISLVQKLGFDVERKSIQHLLGVHIAWHEKENSGNKMKRMNNGIGGIQQVVQLWLNNIIPMLIGSVGAVVILSRIDPFTGIVFAIYVAVYYAISHAMAPSAAAAVDKTNIQSEKVNGLEYQAVHNIRTVKVMGMRAPLLTKLQEEFSTLYELIRRRTIVFQKRNTLLALWTHGVRVSLLTYILYWTVQGKYEVGFFILFADYFSRIREIASNLSDLGQELIISRYSVGRLQEMHSLPIVENADNERQLLSTDWRQLSLDAVSFTYEKEQVLNNISLEIKRGEKIGIVGLSGAGKSTLFKLLLKEYENFSGSIQFDGTDIKQIKTSDYFKHVAVVLQDTEVFNFSVKENITLANDAEKDNPELLARALHISHVEDFLHKLPEGVDSLIGEKGVKLSGGERQRLGIARAVFKQPQLLLLDEATSHLDVESEEKIQDSLHQFFENVTAIVIAHRLTTVKAMDRIYVLEDGTIKESGTFNELYKAKGRFYELWEKQKL